MTLPRYTTGIFRERWWARYEAFGPDPFLDEEFLALCLSQFLRRNPLPVGRALLERFQSLPGVFDAPVEDLAQVPGMTVRAARFLHLVKQAGSRYLKARLPGKDALQHAGDVLAYVRHHLACLPYEVLQLIHLNAKNQVIAVETLAKGTIDQTVVYPRLVVQAALKQNAASLVFVHNHPSGNATPSRQDRELTQALVAACEAVDIKVHDHLVIGQEGWFSFREYGWLTPAKPSTQTAATR